jgi:hypothetical protein
VTGRRVGSVGRAGSFVDDVGFALLFPTPRALVPSLWEAVAGEDVEPFATGMDANEQKVWTWKDDLPRRRLAWYGTFVSGRGSFVSPSLLRLLYPGTGDLDDHDALDLSPTAHEIAEALSPEPLPSATLRKIIGDRSRYQRGIVELQRQLIVTSAGVQEQSSGWPSGVLDLTCRRFDVGGGADPVSAAGVFVGTVLETTSADLARAFRWPVTEARAHLDTLAAADRAIAEGDRYLAPSLSHQVR